MTDAAPGRFDSLRRPWVAKTAGAFAVAVALIVAAHYALNVKPAYDATMLRARATQDLFALYDLQVAHRRRAGAYAADLETLLRGSSDGGTTLRASLQAHTHLDTLVVDGDADKFRLEANVRDPERTLLKVKGPRAGVPRPR